MWPSSLTLSLWFGLTRVYFLRVRLECPEFIQVLRSRFRFMHWYVLLLFKTFIASQEEQPVRIATSSGSIVAEIS